MSRRRESRLEIVNAEGVLRILRDVVVRRTADGEFIVIGGEAGIRGEVLTIHVAADGNKPVPVRVIDSHPTIVGGCVRHQLRLMPLEREASRPVHVTGDRRAEGE